MLRTTQFIIILLTQEALFILYLHFTTRIVGKSICDPRAQAFQWKQKTQFTHQLYERISIANGKDKKKKKNEYAWSSDKWTPCRKVDFVLYPRIAVLYIDSRETTAPQ